MISMGSATKFAALNTKIQGMSGKLLKNDDYISLLEAISVREAMSYLKDNTYYGDFFSEVGEGRDEIEKFEVLSRKHLIDIHEKLICYTHGVYKDIFKLFFIRGEIEDLKIYLRHFVRQYDRSNISNIVVAKGKRSTLDYDYLNESSSLEDFIERLKGTRYYKILKLYVGEEQKKILFYMEMNLDRIYFKALTEIFMSLSGFEKDSLMMTLGQNIDFLNFQWIYRGLKYYDLSPEELLNYSLGHGYYLKYNQLKTFCYSDDADEVLMEIKKTKYGELLSYEDDLERFLEIQMERIVYKSIRDNEKKNTMNILKSMTFIHQVEYEMRDIFTIIEAKRYHLTGDEIKKYLIREIV